MFLLNRPITWQHDCIEYEADQRHVEIILRDLGLDSMSNGVVFPCVKFSPHMSPCAWFGACCSAYPLPSVNSSAMLQKKTEAEID